MAPVPFGLSPSGVSCLVTSSRVSLSRLGSGGCSWGGELGLHVVVVGRGSVAQSGSKEGLTARVWAMLAVSWCKPSTRGGEETVAGEGRT